MPLVCYLFICYDISLFNVCLSRVIYVCACLSLVFSLFCVICLIVVRHGIILLRVTHFGWELGERIADYWWSPRGIEEFYSKGLEQTAADLGGSSTTTSKSVARHDPIQPDPTQDATRRKARKRESGRRSGGTFWGRQK